MGRLDRESKLYSVLAAFWISGVWIIKIRAVDMSGVYKGKVISGDWMNSTEACVERLVTLSLLLLKEKR